MTACLVGRTFVSTSHPVGSRRVDDLSSNDVRKDAHWLVRPVVFFENLAIADRRSICHEHDGLVALRALQCPVVLFQLFRVRCFTKMRPKFYPPSYGGLLLII